MRYTIDNVLRRPYIVAAQYEWQKQEDTEIFKEIDEAITENAAGKAIRIDEQS